ncbi:uncharacterized protein LOC119453846 isoform X2 [Dermacentor silvarum]|uniref:uncharacterized protein LOC119453846 isoform X2 n=1 Tax=Dermacentor silvarum TaxID=543639 RepID=UPI0021008C56|nr:uncharacterized protein LOC119453846 isoform X2 [Dermacentor silvarum]
MGRPRVVRSAEEQAAFDERRRELARERARRRRADLAVREREAEALRQRRAADPVLRERQAEAKRQRRAADPELREREAESRRQRRLGVYLENKNNNESLSKASVKFLGATARFQREFLDRNFGASCGVCDRLWFDHDVVLVSGIRSCEQRRNAFDVLKEHYPNRDCNQFKVCGTCKDSLVRGLLPAFSTVNGNADPVVPRTARCVVPICHSRSAPSSILYPLPAELSQRQAWIDFVRGCPCGGARDWNPPSNEISLVCSLHFSVRCFRFQRPRGYSVGYSKCLRRDAVPTLYPIEEQCSSVPNENFPDDTAERLVSSGVEDAAGRTPNSLASSRSVAGQDRGHCASDQDTARRLAHLAAFELTFLKNVSTQCSVEMASKAASCAVRTVSKSVQCSG